MKIQTDKTHVQRFHDRELMEQGYEATFNDNGEATVQEDVGEALVEKYDAFTEVTTE